MDVRAHLQQMRAADVRDQFRAAGEILFGTEDAREFLWGHSKVLLDTHETVLRVLRLLARAPFAPCFHVINGTQMFLPFGMDDADAHLVYVDRAKAPPLLSLAFLPLVPHLQTRRWSPANRDSVVVFVHDDIDPLDWEAHRRPLLDHYVMRILGESSNPASVREMLRPLIEK